MNKKGFSLVEMLAVVFIVGILSAIALPQYGRVRERARFARVQVVAKSMYDSCERMLSEFDIEYNGPGNEKYHKVSRLDIGNNNLLPPGFSIATGDTSISGLGFSLTLDSTKPDCVVKITKPNESSLQIVFDGTNFTCSDSSTQLCGDYGLD